MGIIESFRQAITERDNATACPVRVSVVATGLLYHVGAIVGIALHSMTLDMATLGLYVQHMGMLAGIAGGAIGVKSALKGDAQ